MDKIEISGLYIISDQFFTDYPNDNYMQNKGEARPHYYAIKDDDGIFWMIPMSTKVDKYRAKIKDTELKHGKNSCFMYYIAPIYGKERAILICDMFPVTEKYILRPYTIDGTPYIVQNKKICKDINTKAKRYLSMVKRGIIASPLNVMSTKAKLIVNK